MEANPSTTARLAAAAARTRTPEQEAGNRGDRLTTDPADRRKRANAALLELVVAQATRRR
jgi:hypothetical protein